MASEEWTVVRDQACYFPTNKCVIYAGLSALSSAIHLRHRRFLTYSQPETKNAPKHINWQNHKTASLTNQESMLTQESIE